MSKVRITVVMVDRANYGRLYPLLKQMKETTEIELSIVCCGSMVLERFHSPAQSVSNQLNVVVYPIYHEVEGSTYQSSVNSMSMLMPQLALQLRRLTPDFVLMIGDRFEALSVATVCSVMGFCLVHLQGGEQSGNIDNSIRHAITKLSHYHVPATNDARKRLLQMGEKEWSILAMGCPSVDMTKYVKRQKDLADVLLCIYHPETGINNSYIVLQLLRQLEKTKKQVIMLWPNIDPGSDGIHKTIRRYIEENKPDWLSMHVNFNPIEYMSLLASVRCCVGNSSSFVRDASFFGTPVVLLGNRQVGRVKTHNIKWFNDYDLSQLPLVINEHMQKVFERSDYYGKEGVSVQIIDAILKATPYNLKVQNV